MTDIDYSGPLRGEPALPATPRPARWPSLLAGIMVGIGLTCIAWRAFGAEMPAERTWQIWDEAANKPFHPHKFVSVTACNVDIAFVKSDGGKRLACRKVAK